MSLCTLLHLKCDHCGDPFPAVGVCPAPMDGAIYSVAELRQDARDQGWTRQHFQRFFRDLCPSCGKKAKKAGHK